MSVSNVSVFIFGAGIRTRELIKLGAFSELVVLGIIDNHFVDGETYCGFRLYNPMDIVDMEFNYIIVTVKSPKACREIDNQLKQLNIDPEKILYVYNDYNEMEKHVIGCCNDRLKDLSSILWKESIKNKISVDGFLPTECSYDFVDVYKVIGCGLLGDDVEYLKDYFRFRTIELCANELRNRDVSGNVAELGVYKGTCSALINSLFPNSKLYLYDTFTSFDDEEYKSEVDNNTVARDFKDRFVDTSIELVMSKMRFPENVVIRKGFFPDSLNEVDYNEKFSFVSLDVDIEESTYQGLSFFYPRLIEGGYIFMHDYNDGMLYDCGHNAIRRFECDNEIKLKVVPIADNCGSLIILK